VRVPPWEETLLLLCAHACGHGRVTMKDLNDLRVLLSAGNGGDRRRLVALVSEHGLEGIAGEMARLSERVYGTPLMGDDLRSALRPDPAAAFCLRWALFEEDYTVPLYALYPLRALSGFRFERRRVGPAGAALRTIRDLSFFLKYDLLKRCDSRLPADIIYYLDRPWRPVIARDGLRPGVTVFLMPIGDDGPASLDRACESLARSIARAARGAPRALDGITVARAGDVEIVDTPCGSFLPSLNCIVRRARAARRP